MNVFISYSSKEANEAYLIKGVLEKNGISAWMAPESIAPGSNYTKEIPVAIRNCEVFLLVLSTVAQESMWVSAEVETAFKNGKLIIPFIVENCPLNDDFDFLLSRSQRIVAYDKKAEALSELVSRIKSVTAVNNQKFDIEPMKSACSEKEEETPVPVALPEPEKEKKAPAVSTAPESNVTAGKKTYPDGSVYEGELVNGEANGKGKETRSNGTVKEGTFVDGKLIKGKFSTSDGFLFEGEFVNSKLNGKGKIILYDGTVKEGNFIDGNLIKGKLSMPGGSVYEGEFVDGKLHGNGKRILKTGTVFEGKFTKGMLVDKGRIKIVFPDSFVFEGDYTDGEIRCVKNGVVIFVDSDCNVYEGNFINGKLNGKGKKITSEGRMYEGYFVDGKLNGKGKISGKDGYVKEGNFVDGVLHGKGMKTYYKGGRIFKGKFENDMLKNGYICDGNGKKIKKVVNGKKKDLGPLGF